MTALALPTPRSTRATPNCVWRSCSTPARSSRCVPATTAASFAARGTIDGAPAVAFCTDATVMGGAMGAEGCRHIVDAIDAAVRERVPVIGLWHSGGARLAEGVEALHAVGLVFQAMIRASGRVPQISVVLGPAAGGAAYGPALTDLVIMSTGGRVFVTGPDVVRSVTGENVDMESLGGADTHGRRSGVVHITTDDRGRGARGARSGDVPARPAGLVRPRRRSARTSTSARCCPRTPSAPTTCTRSSPASSTTARSSSCTRGGRRTSSPASAGSTGRTVGVIANNPLRLGGCLDSPSAEKAARFVRMCDAFGVPLVVLVDVPGYLPGVGQEWDGIVRRGAKLLHAFGEAVVPRVTLVTRKTYGGAYIAMNSRSLGRDPGVRVAGRRGGRHGRVGGGRDPAPQEAGRRASRRARGVARRSWPRSTSASPAASPGRWRLGVVDELIEPSRTRAALADALAAGAGRTRRARQHPAVVR